MYKDIFIEFRGGVTEFIEALKKFTSEYGYLFGKRGFAKNKLEDESVFYGKAKLEEIQTDFKIVNANQKTSSSFLDKFIYISKQNHSLIRPFVFLNFFYLIILFMILVIKR